MASQGREEREPMGQRDEEVERRMAGALANVGHLLHDLWHHNTDEERERIAWRVEEAIGRYHADPSEILSYFGRDVDTPFHQASGGI